MLSFISKSYFHPHCSTPLIFCYIIDALGDRIMIKDIMKDPIFLTQKSIASSREDLSTAQDLIETLTAHRDGCVGMAANMIGVAKRIIVFDCK